jgi:hypothetical protein
MAHQVAAFILSQGRRNFCFNKSGCEFRDWSEVTPALHHPTCKGHTKMLYPTESGCHIAKPPRY